MSKQLTQAEKLTWFKTNFRPHFDEWVEATAKRMVDAGDDVGVAMPAFIWLTCSVDWLAGFWWGKSTQDHVREAFTGFVKKYFPNTYDPSRLYDSLRNGLVHSFTIKKGHYALKHRHPEMHLHPNSQGFELLNLENFYQDWLNAKNQFFDDIEKTPEMLDLAYERYSREGFLDVIEVAFTENTND